jgi:hypothetical protein
METCHKYTQTYVYCGMIKRWIARNLMLGRENGQAFPKGEHLDVPNLISGTDSYYFYLRNKEGLSVVCRLALRSNGHCEYWFALSMPHLPPLLLEGRAPSNSTIYPSIEGLSFIPQPSGSWRVNIEFPNHALKATLHFTPTTPILDFASLRDKNQIAGALASMPWNSASFKALKSMKTEHIEQAGTWQGELFWNGTNHSIQGVGARDHSRGERSWHQWNAHCWFTGFNEYGLGFNLSLIDFKGLPTLRAGYISRSHQKAVGLVDGPVSPIAQTSGDFILAGQGDLKPEKIDFFTEGFFDFTMDSVYKIEEGFGYFEWKGDRFLGILERGRRINGFKHAF